MKAVFLIPLLALAACASKPPAPIPPPITPPSCASVGSCGDGPKPLHAELGGIGAEHTVQLMVNSPMLIGGKAAEPGLWPASVYARAGNSACSATIVGDRTVFMAAHCMGDGAQISFAAGANQYKARCTHHPEYRGNSTADWALCSVDRPVTGIPFEVLGTTKKLSIGTVLLLSGYGCINPGGGGGNDGIFRIGNATIRSLPSGKNYDVTTQGGAALCFGDSGGAAYLVDGDGNRAIVGVNSRGDIRTMSYLPSVAASTFISWADGWASKNGNTRICGLHADALGCRGAIAPPPQPDGKFEYTGKAACVKGAIAPEYNAQKEAIVESIKRAIDIF